MEKPSQQTKRDKVNEAIEKAKRESAAAKNRHVPGVATIATDKPKPPRTPKWGDKYTAKARDERMAARGRLPSDTVLSLVWREKQWVGRMTIYTAVPGKSYSKELHGDTLFDTLERLDVAYWEWFAATPDDDPVKAAITAGQTVTAGEVSPKPVTDLPA